MIPAADFIAFLTASLVLALTPGNDVLFIASQGLGSGLKGSIAATIGVSFGLLFHLAALTLGLSELMLYSPWLLTVIKFLGASYLFYLAYKAFRTKNNSLEPIAAAPLTFRKIFFRGTLTNLTNPKVALFFLAFIPQFIQPEQGGVPSQMLLLGLSFLIIGSTTNSLYALLFGMASEKFKNNAKFNRLLGKLTGVIFLCLAIRLFF